MVAAHVARYTADMANDPVDLALGLDDPPPIDETKAVALVRDAIAHLVEDQLFFASMLMGMKLVTGKEAARMVPTACVFIASGLRFGLAVNPLFFETLTMRQRMGVLEHEMLHLVYYHLSRMPEFPHKRRFNIAADMVINQVIDEDKYWIDPAPILPGLIPELNLPDNQTVDFYYKALEPGERPAEQPKFPPQGPTGDTQVHTPSGPKAIKDIQIGDRVIVWNFNSNQRFVRFVRQLQSDDNPIAPLMSINDDLAALTCSPLATFAAPKGGPPFRSDPNPAIAFKRPHTLLAFDPNTGQLAPVPVQYDPANVMVTPPGLIIDEDTLITDIFPNAPVQKTYGLLLDGLEANFFAGPHGILFVAQVSPDAGGEGGEGGGGEGEGDGEEQPFRVGDKVIITQGPRKGEEGVVTYASDPDVNGVQDLEVDPLPSAGGSYTPMKLLHAMSGSDLNSNMVRRQGKGKGKGKGGGERGEGEESEGGEPGEGRGHGGLRWKRPPVTPDDHSRWGETDEDGRNTPSHITEHMIDELIEEARENAQKTGHWGKLPGHFQDLVDERLQPKINWRHELKKFTGRVIKVGSRRTRKKPDRRFSWDQPGRKPRRAADLIVVVDTSMSVGEAEMTQFRAEIDAMLPANVVVMDVDTQIHRIYKWNLHEETWKPEGRGGTSFQPPFTAITDGTHPLDENNLLARPPGGIIYLTDGEAAHPTFELDIPVLWVYTQRNYVGSQPFGEAIFLDITAK